MRRRSREPNPLACPSTIREVLDELREQMPGAVPSSDKKWRKLLNAVKHVEDYSASETARGRPGHFDRELLLEVGRHLKGLLAKRSRGRVSLSSFISFYLPILDYPAEIREALENERINRVEASLLSRLTAERLEVSPQQARAIRREVLANHLRMEGSQNSLRNRVSELLGDQSLMTSENMTAAVQEVDELLRVDPEDRRHLFYEQMKDFFFALRDVRPEEIDDGTLDLMTRRADELMEVVHSIQRKRKQKEKPTPKFTI